MFTVSVSHGAFKALTLCAGTDAIRTMLTGICVDTTTAGRVHLVTTDGHRMLVVNAKLEEGTPIAGRYILPLFDCKGIKQAGTERYPQPIRIDIDLSEVKAGTFRIHGKETRAGLLMPEQFPQWQRVVPRTVSGKLAQFNGAYLGDFQRAAELLGRDFPVIRHNGDSGAIIDLGADAFGVLMPIRCPTEYAGLPDWLDTPKAEQKKAA